MINQQFFDAIFPGFWNAVDRSHLVTDENNMLGDAAVFEWLIKTVRPRDIIEIGSWKGHSANLMIDTCKAEGLDSRIVCVDTFLGGPEHWLLPGSIETLNRQNGQPRILDAFLGNTLASGNAGRVFPLCVDSASATHVFAHLGFKSDLIFIDGGHDYHVVSRDILGYFPFLSVNGVMFGDDYQYEPLANAVHDCAKKLGVQVLVTARKWIYLTDALIQKLALPDMQIRTSFEGWVHP